MSCTIDDPEIAKFICNAISTSDILTSAIHIAKVDSDKLLKFQNDLYATAGFPNLKVTKDDIQELIDQAKDVVAAIPPAKFPR